MNKQTGSLKPVRGHMVVIQPEGLMSGRDFTGLYGQDGGPTLEMFQKAVGGSIEIVPGFVRFNRGRAVVFCNEEGKIRHLPMNAIATVIWQLNFPEGECPDDILFGPVVIVTGDEEFLESL